MVKQARKKKGGKKRKDGEVREAGREGDQEQRRETGQVGKGAAGTKGHVAGGEGHGGHERGSGGEARRAGRGGCTPTRNGE
jgi:hypothetical protein